MMRPYLQRSAQLGRYLCRQAPILRTGRTPLPAVALPLRTPAPLTPSILRLYSSDAAAAAAPATDSPSASSDDPITKFADIHKLGVHVALRDAITRGFGYETMSDVQAKTLPIAMKGSDIVAQAKTGTGKTLGFLVPVVQRMLEQDPGLLTKRARRSADSTDIRAIILSPTRELATQIADEAQRLVKNTGIVVQVAVGGNSKQAMLRKTQIEGCHLLVATPGRLNDLLSDKYSGIAAPDLRALVLDEADRMLDVGFEPQLREILTYLPNKETTKYQTLLYSATVPKTVVQLARNYVDHDNFKFVQTIDPNDTPTHETVPQHIITTPGWENIYPTLFELLEREAREAETNPGEMPFKAMVFFSQTANVELAAELMYHLQHHLPRGLRVLNIHGKLTQASRTRTADDFRRLKSAILLSTDVTARGLDFPNVSHVIQVGLPPDRDQYVHRIGRTGRAGKPGEGWIIIQEFDLQEARERLAGLPIKPHREIKSATHNVQSDDHSNADAPRAAAHVSNAFRKTDRAAMKRAYRAALGNLNRFRKRETVASLNEWAIRGWGWDTPPGLDKRTADKLGLSNIPGIVIDNRSSDFDDRRGFGERRSFDERRGFGDRGAFGGRGGSGGRGGFGGRGRPRDQFDFAGRDERGPPRRPRASF